ncbi:MAG: hypothetical protein V3U76_14080 [Granulosicoccus sp.]
MNRIAVTSQIVLVFLTTLPLSAAVFAAPVDNVVATAVSANEVKLAWNTQADAAYYDVYQDSMRAVTGLSDTTVVIEDLSPATTYQFFITACDVSGVCTEASSQVDVTTQDSGPDSPETCPPSSDGSSPVATYVNHQDGTATLSWCSVEEALGYNLFISGDYVSTIYGTSIDFDTLIEVDNEYQVAWFSENNYPAKSAIATETGGADRPETPESAGALAQLEAANRLSENAIEVFFTRHAEKMTMQEETSDGAYEDVCGVDKCAEVLNTKGELRAELLADAFYEAGITSRLTHAFSSHKIRTRQTIEMITADAGLASDIDKNPGDGIQELPVSNDDGSDATELNPESTKRSKAPTIAALMNLAPGSVVLVAGHSGTLYDIMAGIGLDDACVKAAVETCDQARYPINAKGKVKNFGDIWKVTLIDGAAEFVYRANLQPLALELNELAQ